MLLPETPSRLNLNTISRHLLGARTNWQNVQDEAREGCHMARDVIHSHERHHTVSVQTLRAYLAHIATRRDGAMAAAE
jgi:hypothetical protein